MEFVENVPENPEINYLRNPVNGGSELEKLMKLVENQLKNVMEPTLIIQGSDDPVVNSVSALEIFEKLGTKGKAASPNLRPASRHFAGEEKQIMSMRWF